MIMIMITMKVIKIMMLIKIMMMMAMMDELAETLQLWLWEARRFQQCSFF